MLFFLIIAKSKEEANILFETLNAKGLELRQIDLIKNRLCSVIGDHPHDYVEEYWGKINKILFSSDNFESVDISTFYRHFWISKYNRSSDKELYAKFISSITPHEKNTYLDFLKGLLNNSQNYMKITNPKLSDFNNRKQFISLVNSIKSINEFGVILHKVPLLSLFEIYDNGLIKASKLTEVANYLEVFHFSFNVCAKKPNNKVDQIYSNFAINVRKCKSRDEVNKKINDLLFVPLCQMIPNKESFEKGFINLEYDKNEDFDNCKSRYAIYKINTIYDEDILFPSNASIEHVINESNRGISLNVGNLLLIDSSTNEKMNKCKIIEYKDKKKYYKKSKYKWPKEFVKNYKTWNINDINVRAIYLADLYYDSFVSKLLDLTKF